MCSLKEPAEEYCLARMKRNYRVDSRYLISRNPLLLKEDSHESYLEIPQKLEIRMHWKPELSAGLK